MSIHAPYSQFSVQSKDGDRLPVGDAVVPESVQEGDIEGAMYEVVQQLIAEIEENSDGAPSGADWVAFFDGFNITAELITRDSDGMAGPEESVTKSI